MKAHNRESIAGKDVIAAARFCRERKSRDANLLAGCPVTSSVYLHLTISNDDVCLCVCKCFFRGVTDVVVGLALQQTQMECGPERSCLHDL